MNPVSPTIVEADFHALVDGQLAPERRAMVLGFLRENPLDARRVALWRGQRDMLHASFDHVARERVPLALAVGATSANRFVARRVTQALPPLEARHLLEAAIVAPTKPKATSTSMAAFIFGLSVAFAMMAIALFVIGQTPPRQGPRAKAVALAADEYASFAKLPPEIAGPDAGSVAATLSRLLGRVVIVPDFSKSGWHILGARLGAGAAKANAFVLYRNEGNEMLGLSIGPENSGRWPTEAFALTHAQAVVFSAKGQDMILIGRRDSAALLRITQQSP